MMKPAASKCKQNEFSIAAYVHKLNMLEHPDVYEPQLQLTTGPGTSSLSSNGSAQLIY